MGAGARTHCDIVVKVDGSRSRILAIGGNVRGSVSLKLLPAASEPGKELSPVGGARRMFAHLKLRAESIEEDALDRTPTMRALGCATGSRRRPGSPPRIWWPRAPAPPGADGGAKGRRSPTPIDRRDTIV